MWRWLACAVLLGASGCRPKACDDAALQQVATVFADRSSEGRAAGFEALREACPALPRGLQTDLLARFRYAPGDPNEGTLFPPAGDEAHAALFRRTCAHPLEHFDPDDFDHRLRESCDLDRYGVLAADEPFVRDDIVAFMLYEWLTTTSADPDVARTVARALMYVEAADDERELMCERWGEGCMHVVARLGIELPHSTSNLPRQRALGVAITHTQVTIDGERILALTDDDAFEHHVAPTLLDALDDDPDRAVLVHADRDTQFGTLADVFFTATKAGRTSTDLAVVDGHALRRIPIAVPRAWLPPREWPRPERSLELTVRVRRDGVELGVNGQGITTERGVPACTGSNCDVKESLAAKVTEYKKLFPHETVATYVVDDDVPLQTLVSIMDIVRGLECKFPLDNGEIPEECLFWQSIIETDPPLFWNMNLITGIHLGEPDVDELPAGRVPTKALLAEIAAEHEAIEACLLAQLPLLRDLDGHLLVSVARAPDEHLVAHVLERGFDGTPLERCVLDPLDLALPVHDGSWDFMASVGVELRIPVTLDLRSSDP